MTRHIVVLLILLIPSISSAKGERERLSLLAARVKWGLEFQGQMPTTDPHLNLRNVPRESSPEVKPTPPAEPTPVEQPAPHVEPEVKGSSEPLSYADVNAELTEKLAAQEAETKRMRDNFEKKLAEQQAELEKNKKPASMARAAPPSVVLDPPELTLTAPAMASGPVAYHLQAWNGEDVHGEGWCRYCGPMKKEFDGRTDMVLHWSTEEAPAWALKQVQFKDRKTGRMIWTSGGYPVVGWTDAKGIPRWTNGYKSPTELLEIIEGNDPPDQTMPVAAAGVGGALKVGPQIKEAIDMWRQYIGEGVEVRYRLDKTGGALNLLKATTWTPQMAFGKFGHFSVKNLPSTVPIRERAVGFTYYLDDPAYPKFAVDPFTIDSNAMAAKRFSSGPGEYSLESPFPQPQAYGIGLDPISIGVDIYQLVRFIYAITHPQASVSIPGTVEWTIVLKGDALIITIADPYPLVTVDVWFKWQLPLKKVTVTTQYVDVEFSKKGQERYFFPIERRRIQISGAYGAVSVPELPPDEQSELVDAPIPLAYGAAPPSGQYDDPHDDPRWGHTKRECKKTLLKCEVAGCTDDPYGDAFHHQISAWLCVLAGYYDMAVEPVGLQKIRRLCEHHHAEIGHGIGYGGSWRKFNLDLDADIEAGYWNSRGQSEWRFTTDEEAVSWLKARMRAFEKKKPKQHAATQIMQAVARYCTLLLGDEWIEAGFGYTRPSHLINVHGANPAEVEKYKDDQHMLNRIHGRYHGPARTYTVAP